MTKQKKIQLVQAYICEAILNSHELTAEEVVEKIDSEIVGLELRGGFKRIFFQEIPYLTKYGDTALNCGYVGKTL